VKNESSREEKIKVLDPLLPPRESNPVREGKIGRQLPELGEKLLNDLPKKKVLRFLMHVTRDHGATIVQGHAKGIPRQKNHKKK